MAQESSLAELVEEIRKAAEGMADGDARTNARIDTIEKSLNALMVKVQRPGSDRSANDNDLIRKEAADFCVLRRNVTVPKSESLHPQQAPSIRAANPASDSRLEFKEGAKPTSSIRIGLKRRILPDDQNVKLLQIGKHHRRVARKAVGKLGDDVDRASVQHEADLVLDRRRREQGPPNRI